MRSGQSTRDVQRRMYQAELDQARAVWDTRAQAEAQKHKLLDAYERAVDLGVVQGLDPLAEAKAALQQLRRHPDDGRAADRLEKALKRLEAERQNQPKSPQPAGPTKR